MRCMSDAKDCLDIWVYRMIMRLNMNIDRNYTHGLGGKKRMGSCRIHNLF